MPDQSPILSIPFILPAQAQKHVTHNEAVRLLDVLVQLVVQDRDRTEAPSTLVDGLRHIVGPGAVGDWAGKDGQIAVAEDGGWTFIPAQRGWQAHVLAESQMAVFDGLAWVVAADADLRARSLGIGGAADATNRLVVSSPAVLMNHAGAGMQVKLNKAAAGDTASLLFQTGFSGRAELGTVAGEDFQIKVSPDGANFHTALQADGATGALTAPNGLTVAGALTGTGVVGSVAQVAGTPTGAVMERGTTPGGSYLRFADGTQICSFAGLSAANAATAVGALFRSAVVAWDFPAPFAVPPVVTGMAQTGGAWVVADAAPTGSSAGLRVVSATSLAGPVAFSAMAVGRWF
jgi:hypothetical protein